jgi:hypothetical protein
VKQTELQRIAAVPYQFETCMRREITRAGSLVPLSMRVSAAARVGVQIECAALRKLPLRSGSDTSSMRLLLRLLSIGTATTTGMAFLGSVAVQCKS